jgi:hypothetical protein
MIENIWVGGVLCDLCEFKKCMYWWKLWKAWDKKICVSVIAWTHSTGSVGALA